MVSAMRPHHFRLLFELIGRHDIADDPDLQGHNDRIRNAAKIIKALQETMPTKTTEEWIDILQPKGRVLRAGQQLHRVSRASACQGIGRGRLDRAGRLRPYAGRQHPGPAAGRPRTRRNSTRRISARTVPKSYANWALARPRSTPSSAVGGVGAPATRGEGGGVSYGAHDLPDRAHLARS